MRCKPGQDFLPYDRPIAVSKIGSTSQVLENRECPRKIGAAIAEKNGFLDAFHTRAFASLNADNTRNRGFFAGLSGRALRVLKKRGSVKVRIRAGYVTSALRGRPRGSLFLAPLVDRQCGDWLLAASPTEFSDSSACVSAASSKFAPCHARLVPPVPAALRSSAACHQTTAASG